MARAARWLHKSRGCQPVFAEMHTWSDERPDVIGWHNGISHVVEAKVSRSDFAADKNKPWLASETAGMGRFRWYAVPSGLVTAEEVPAWCGLVYVGKNVRIIKDAPRRLIDHGSSIRENIMLASAVRRFMLGTVFRASDYRWETLEAKEQRLAPAKAVVPQDGFVALKDGV